MQDQSIAKIDGGMIGNGRRHLHQDAIAHLNFFWPHLRKAYFFEVVEVQVLAAFPQATDRLLAAVEQLYEPRFAGVGCIGFHRVKP